MTRRPADPMAGTLTIDAANVRGGESVPDLPELSAKELAAYSVTRALAVAAYAHQGPSLEREVADAYAAAMRHVNTRGFLIPLAALHTGTPAAGGNAVFEGAGPLIEELRPRSVLASMGATLIADTRLPFGMPRVDGAPDAEFVSENPGADQPDDDSQYGKVEFRPRTAYTGTAYTRELLVTSSPRLERRVRTDLSRRIMAAWDRTGLTGDGVLEPLGLLNTPGLAIVEAGDTPPEPDPPTGGVPTWAHILELERTVADADADPLGPAAYISTPRIRELLKRTERAPGSGMVWSGQTMNGYPAAVSKRVPSNLTKGADVGLHAILFGVWSELVLALFPVVDVVVDPITRVRRGLIDVAAYSIGDVQTLHLDAFAAIVDAKLG